MEKSNVSEVTQNEREEFFNQISIVLNEEDPSFDMVNPVQVQQMFARATSLSARLAQTAEEITDEVANYVYLKEKAERSLQKLRKQILSENWKDAIRATNTEKLDALILLVAGDSLQEMQELEVKIEEYDDQIKLRLPRLEKIKFRMKVLDGNMEKAKQYLDYEKLLKRLEELRH